MNWDTIENLVSSLGTDTFSRAFFDFWNHTFRIDQCTAWELNPDRAPLTLVSERPGEKETIEKLCRLYTDKMYISDPETAQAGPHALKNADQRIAVNRVTTQEMGKGQYCRILFEEVDLQEKVFILCNHNDNTYYMNVYRRQGPPHFSKEEIAQCKALASLATALLDKHRTLLPHHTDHASANLLEELHRFFIAHPSKLSQREAATCAYIVTGHSNEAISLHLGVSLNTARTFRRRAYAKLNLATQSELFALYLEYSQS